MAEAASSEQWWNWWLASGPLGAATWAGTALSAIGLAISIFGFYAAIKAATLAAKEASAATRAVEQLKSARGSRYLANAHSQVGLVLQFVDGKHYSPARVLLATLRREMLLVAQDLRVTANNSSDLTRRMAIISSHIGYAERSDSKFKPKTLQSTLESIQGTIVEWEISLREKDNEVSK